MTGSSTPKADPHHRLRGLRRIRVLAPQVPTSQTRLALRKLIPLTITIRETNFHG